MTRSWKKTRFPKNDAALFIFLRLLYFLALPSLHRQYGGRLFLRHSTHPSEKSCQALPWSTIGRGRRTHVSTVRRANSISPEKRTLRKPDRNAAVKPNIGLGTPRATQRRVWDGIKNIWHTYKKHALPTGSKMLPRWCDTPFCPPPPGSRKSTCYCPLTPGRIEA